MKELYKDILNNLHEESNLEPLHLNSRVLLIDSMNTFLRSFAMIPAINPQGNHVGGLVGFLKSLGYVIKLIRPTRVILVFDGQGNITNRRNTYAEYKANRQIKRITNFKVFSTLEEESDSISTQMLRLLDYLKCLPVNISIIDKIEADDTIAYLSQKLKDDVIIYSADQDFLQLVNKRITVYSPIKKKFYRPNDVYEQYGMHPYNFITMKCLMGDKSDNLEGIKGLGPKKIAKVIPEIVGREINLDYLVHYASTQDTLMHKRITENKVNLETNEKMMSLKDPLMSGQIKIHLNDLHARPMNLLHRNDFISLYNNDYMGTNLQNPDIWLTDHFLKLNNLAQLTHE